MKRFLIAMLWIAGGTASAKRPARECTTKYGEAACGYHCVGNYGQIRCARTPAGACASNYGQVVCWDPPGGVGLYAHPAVCISNYGKIACGYGCVANYGELKCAASPDAQCYVRAGQLLCSDGTQ